MCVSIHINKYNMQNLNNGFNKFKMDDSTHVFMLIVQEMWENSLNHSYNCKILNCMCMIIRARCNLWVIVLTY
jgi:hypothetical protein